MFWRSWHYVREGICLFLMKFINYYYYSYETYIEPLTKIFGLHLLVMIFLNNIDKFRDSLVFIVILYPRVYKSIQSIIIFCIVHTSLNKMHW